VIVHSIGVVLVVLVGLVVLGMDGRVGRDCVWLVYGSTHTHSLLSLAILVVNGGTIKNVISIIILGIGIVIGIRTTLLKVSIISICISICISISVITTSFSFSFSDSDDYS
jgi:hypothetical protein